MPRPPLRQPRYEADYTIGKLALLFECGSNTIKRWLNRGRLVSFHTNLPRHQREARRARCRGQQHRKIRRVHLGEIERFCRKHAPSFDYVLKKLRLAAMDQAARGNSPAPAPEPPQEPAGIEERPAAEYNPEITSESALVPEVTTMAVLRYDVHGKILPRNAYTAGLLAQLLGYSRHVIRRLLEQNLIDSYRLPAPNPNWSPPPHGTSYTSAAWIGQIHSAYGEYRVSHAALVSYCRRHGREDVLARFAQPQPQSPHNRPERPAEAMPAASIEASTAAPPEPPEALQTQRLRDALQRFGCPLEPRSNGQSGPS
jgi:hypothetical protein